MNIRSLIRSVVASVLTAASFTPAAAQEPQPTTGTIRGRVIDKTSGTPLANVGVQVVGLDGVGMSTNADGQFSFAKIPAGSITLQFRRVGYTAKTVTGISLGRGSTVTQDVTLEPFTPTLSTEVVTASAERGTVHEALNAQKSAPGIVNSVTAEQISKSADGNAAAAVSRAAGVTLHDNAAVIRGQQDRSTVANLNAARIPSPEPEKKQVPFDIFPSSFIRSIDIYKTFTPDQSGDFSGAVINITTRDFPAERTVSYSSSIGANLAAIRSDVLSAPISSREWFAFAGGNRQLPSAVRSAGNFGSRFYTQSEINGMINSFRNSWTPRERSAMPNSSFSMSYGGSDPILGRDIGYIASLTYSMGQELRENECRARIDGNTGRTAGNEFRGSTGNNSVLWGGLVNLSTFLNDRDVLTFSNMYNRTSDSEAHRDLGRDENIGNEHILERSTLSYVERSIRSNQISLQQQLSDISMLDWSITNSAVTRREPDRSDMVYISTFDAVTQQQNPFALYADISDGARRTFADLDEYSWNFAANYKLSLGGGYDDDYLKFGGVYRLTRRDAEVLQYSIVSMAPLPPSAGTLEAERIFDGRFTQGDEAVFTINPLGQSGSYFASDNQAALYGMGDYSLTDRLRLVGGVRVEDSRVKVTSIDLFGLRRPVQKNFTDILPSLALNYELTDNQQIRLSAARTLARPEYRELSPILNRDVLGGQGFQGDTSLVRTLINNFDLRWEWYPNAGEVFSIALFAKHHDRPIEKVEVPTSGSSIMGFINAESADNYGIELEMRKNLGTMVDVLSPFSIFGNLTLMKSEVRIGQNQSASATNPNRALVGQAPYVINSGLTYSPGDGRLSITGLYNRVGRRINAAGPVPLPDIYELPRDIVDLAIRFPVFFGLDGKIDGKNLLNTPYELRQGDVTRLRYLTGRTLSFGLTWKNN